MNDSICIEHKFYLCSEVVHGYCDKLADERDELKAENIKIRSMLGNEFDDVACDKILANVEELTKERDELKTFIFDLYECRLEPDKLLCLIERKRLELKPKGGK